MEELIKIVNYDGEHMVDARELHSELGSGKDFSTWIRGRIKKYNFMEGNDFRIITQTGDNSRRGPKFIDYYVSMDMAKELCMVERTNKGRATRHYFIAVENRYKQISHSGAFAFDPDNMEHLSLVVDGLIKKTLRLDIENRKQAASIKHQGQLLLESQLNIDSLEQTLDFADEEAHKFRNSVPTTHVAKSLGMRSAQELNKWLCSMGVQYRRGRNYFLCSDYCGKGYDYNNLAKYKDSRQMGQKA